VKQHFSRWSDRLIFIEDSRLQAAIWRIGCWLPLSLSVFTTGLLIRLLTQRKQLEVARRLIDKFCIDVVHLTMPVSPLEPTLLRNLGAPLVIGPLNGGMRYPIGFAHRQARWVTSLLSAGRSAATLFNRVFPGKLQSSLLIAANDRTQRVLDRAFPGMQNRIRQLPENGVDLDFWRDTSRDRPVVDSSHLRPVRLVFVGRLVDWKGVDLLLRAFASACQRCRVPLSLSIAGDGPMRQQWEQLARDLDIIASVPNEPWRVFFHGWLQPEACAQLMRQAEVFVLPSLLECGGAVVLEAMASGLPVIATDWGGPSDYLDETCGVLLPVSSEHELLDAMTSAIVGLACDRSLRDEMGHAGRKKASSHYSWRAKASQMIDIYRIVLKDHG